MTITTQQIIKFHALLRNLNLEEDDKRALIADYTGGRSDRTNDMTFAEAKEMISFLAKQAGEAPTRSVAERSQSDKMRKKIIAIAYQLGWTKPNGKIDMDRLNSFIVSRPVTDYPITQLNDIQYKDLPKLINQFEQILTKHLNQFKR
ncbi:MAG: hypothetical protein M9892_03350 [Bacteroidetes bacterium]|nr:hypothetical protein [Bacteroidota bacterium]